MKIKLPQHHAPLYIETADGSRLIALSAGVVPGQNPAAPGSVVYVAKFPGLRDDSDPVILSRMFNTVTEALAAMASGLEINPATIENDSRWPAVLSGIRTLPGVEIAE